MCAAGDYIITGLNLCLIAHYGLHRTPTAKCQSNPDDRQCTAKAVCMSSMVWKSS